MNDEQLENISFLKAFCLGSVLLLGSDLHEAHSIMVLKHTPLRGGTLEKAGSVGSFVLFCLFFQKTVGGSQYLHRVGAF